MPEIESLPEIHDVLARARTIAVQDRCTLADHRGLGLGQVAT